MELPLDRRRLAGHLRAVGLLRRNRPIRAGGPHHAGAALVKKKDDERLLVPQGVHRLGPRPKRGRQDHHRRHGEMDARLLRRARSRRCSRSIAPKYARQPQDIAQPLKDVIEAAEIFEAERIRKDQFGAIEDAQKAQMTNEAGMTKGATAGSIAIATGCVAASALGQAYIACPACSAARSIPAPSSSRIDRVTLLAAAADEVADDDAEPDREHERGGEIVLHRPPRRRAPRPTHSRERDRTDGSHSCPQST